MEFCSYYHVHLCTCECLHVNVDDINVISHFHEISMEF